MSFLYQHSATTTQSVSFQTKSAKLTTRVMDDRRQTMEDQNVDGKLWRMANCGGLKYGWQIMEDGKLWRMANYGGLKCGWQIMKDNYGWHIMEA